MMEFADSILHEVRVLLVDADKSIRVTMGDYFGKLTRRFATAGSAEEALALLEGPTWDVVISNLRLPGMNGFEFLKRVNYLKPGIKLILSAKNASPGLVKRAADYGVLEVIPSPLSSERILAVLIKTMMQIDGTDSLSAPISADQQKSETENPEAISVLELDESMIITAYVRFSDRYQMINPETCKWVQLNFRGALAVVDRKGQKLELPVKQIMPGDSLLRLVRLPTLLMNLTFVRKQLIRELKER